MSPSRVTFVAQLLCRPDDRPYAMKNVLAKWVSIRKWLELLLYVACMVHRCETNNCQQQQQQQQKQIQFCSVITWTKNIAAHRMSEVINYCYSERTPSPPPLSVWPHLFCGAGHEKRRGEPLKWSLTFRLYIGSFPCAQLPGPVHTARLGRVCFYI